MRVDIPFEITYETVGISPIEDVIDALVSAKLLIEEGGYNLTELVRGLQIESVQVSVRTVSQGSHLRELLLVGIYLAVQQPLEREVPALVEELTGAAVPENFRTLLTLSVLVAIFYGIAYAKDLITHVTTDSKLRRQLRALVTDIAHRTGRTEEEIKNLLDERYKPKPKIKVLAEASFRFFKPSKTQANASIRVNDRQISSDIVSDVPPTYAYEQVLDADTSRNFSAIELELHAQDKDREASGWAAVPKGITEKRLRMKLVDGVMPSDLWGRNQVKGDIIVLYKRVGTDVVPTEIHLMRVIS
jgi:hypothetical protein